jgi:hypothetical protein
MGNNLLMRMKDQFVSTLAVYETAQSTLGFEVDSKRAAEEISEQIVKRYMALVKMAKRQKFVDEAKAEIAMVVDAAASLDKDPWDVCRNENVRIRVAYSFARIIEKKAGDRHKFSVWSGWLHGAGAKGKGLKFLIAAPSRKAAVAMLNAHFKMHETVNWANEHWSMGGTAGESVATKIGIWTNPDEYCEEKDYKFVWEPKQ